MVEEPAAGTAADWQEQQAKTAFNRVWDLIDQHDRSDQDEREMLLAACASRYLWDGIGGDEQLAVGDWQVAHVASLLGQGSLALRFAASALRRVEENGWTDWRLASALEGMARAHAAAGDLPARDDWVARCRRVLSTIADPEDRELVESQLDSIVTGPGDP